MRLRIKHIIFLRCFNYAETEDHKSQIIYQNIVNLKIEMLNYFYCFTLCLTIGTVEYILSYSFRLE